VAQKTCHYEYTAFCSGEGEWRLYSNVLKNAVNILVPKYIKCTSWFLRPTCIPYIGQLLLDVITVFVTECAFVVYERNKTNTIRIVKTRQAMYM